MIFNSFVILSGWLRSIEDAVNVMLNTSTTRLLPVAFDFAVSATDAGIRRPWSVRHCSMTSEARLLSPWHLNTPAMDEMMKS